MKSSVDRSKTRPAQWPPAIAPGSISLVSKTGALRLQLARINLRMIRCRLRMLLPVWRAAGVDRIGHRRIASRYGPTR
jgi:hypothetical protein